MNPVLDKYLEADHSGVTNATASFLVELATGGAFLGANALVHSLHLIAAVWPDLVAKLVASMNVPSHNASEVKQKGRIAELVISQLSDGEFAHVNTVVIFLIAASDERYHEALVTCIPDAVIKAAQAVRDGKADFTTEMRWFQLLLNLSKKRVMFSTLCPRNIIEILQEVSRMVSPMHSQA